LLSKSRAPNDASPAGLRKTEDLQVRTDDQGLFSLPGRQPLDDGIGQFTTSGKGDVDTADRWLPAAVRRCVGTVENHRDAVGTHSAIGGQLPDQGLPARLQVLLIDRAERGGLANQVVSVDDDVERHGKKASTAGCERKGA
jgi:hypothetical protein